MLRSFKSKPIAIYFTNVAEKVKFPERLKGTILEKWANYWKNLCVDYHQMLVDLRQDIQDEPKKALIWGAGLAAAYGLARNNPSELDFKDRVQKISNEMVMVSKDCLNPTSISHLRFLQTCYNEGVIHYRSLGIISFMYVSELTESCDLYKSQCKYLQPTYTTLPKRIVDIGFMGKWWNIYIKTANYDINV